MSKQTGTEEPQRYELYPGQYLACLVCRYELFWQRTAVLGQNVWYTQRLQGSLVLCLYCARCRYIHLFDRVPQPTYADFAPKKPLPE